MLHLCHVGRSSIMIRAAFYKALGMTPQYTSMELLL